MRIKAQSLFEKMSQYHGVITERKNESLKIAIEIDISRIESGVLSLWADDFSAVVQEVISIPDQKSSNPSCPTVVQINFYVSISATRLFSTQIHF